MQHCLQSPFYKALCSWGRIVAICFITFIFCINSASGQTILAPGDVAIVGFNSTGGPSTDNFGFILLTDVEAGTVIYFTDSGVLANNCLRNTEGILKWTAPVGGCTAGTMVQLYTNAVIIPPSVGAVAIVKNTFDFNMSGDQIIVFQHNTEAELTGSEPCPDNYVFALTNNEVWQSTSTDSHTSALPSNLDATTSVAIPLTSGDYNNNSSFDCTVTSGSAADILAGLVDPTNWVGNETDVVPLPDCVFTIGNFMVTYITFNQIQLGWNPLDAGIELVVVYHTAPITDLPSGDGSAYTVGNPFETTGIVAFKGTVANDTFLIITGLTEGQVYYFAAFTHNTSSADWFDGAVSIPESAIAYVQEAVSPTAALAAATNATVNFTWTNYDAPQADWWNGGVAIIAKESSAVTMNRTSMNALGQSTAGLTVGQTLSDDNFVAAIITDGSTMSSATLSSCKTYHFSIFHNDDNQWSDGVAFGPVTTLCPDIKVEGNSIEIVNTDATPSATDHTDFGEVLTTSTLARTFKVKNSGTGTISLTGAPTVSISGDAVFTVTTQPVLTSLVALAETTFQVTFAPVGACNGTTYNAVISIANDDTDENPYTFTVQGKCVAGCFTMSPLSGTPGTTVTITGAGFDGTTAATFDGIAATVTLISPTQITVVVPNGVAGNVDVNTTSAVTPNGCSQFNVIASSGTCPH